MEGGAAGGEGILSRLEIGAITVTLVHTLHFIFLGWKTEQINVSIYFFSLI